MSFNAGDLVASIRMDGLPQFEADNARAQRSFEKTGSAGKAAGAAAKAAFAAAAVTVTSLTVAGGAYLTSLLRTGAAYNTLQQTSRAALNTLLGGTKQAADQMAKLDDFARNSPFSKAVFISAQQQLIGFGVEAKKVIPILGAVQDAVAATGGSSNEIASVVEVLAKIKSQGKITGEELLQLGGRGIDAAGLIGKSLGKSGAEIKESITKGTISADQALDALAAGMAATYGGAAAEVKKTWTGAVDRIKAANREIGAALAEPFISQQGGGMAVMWGNQVADVLRAILTHAQPVVQMFQNRLMPSFSTFTDFLDRARVTIKSWDSAKLEHFLNMAAEYAPALGALAGGLISLVGGALPVIGPFVRAIGPLPAILAGMAAASPELRAAIGDLVGAFAPLLPVVTETSQMIAAGLNVVIPVAAQVIRATTSVVAPFVQALAAIPPPVLAAVAAFFAFNQASEPIVPILEGLIEGFKLWVPLLQARHAELVAEGATKIGAAFEIAKGGVLGFGDGIKSVFLGANPVALIVLAAAAAVAGLVAAFMAQAQHTAEVVQQTATYRDTLVQTTGAITAATEAQIEKNLADAGALDAGKKLGLSKDVLIRAVKGEADALAIVSAAYKEYAGIVELNGITQEKEFNREAGLVNGTVMEQAQILADAQEETRRLAEEARLAAAGMSEMERSNTRMNAALEIARDVSRDATERLNALKQALDELNGGTKTQADLEQELNDRTRSLSDAFNVADETGKKLGDSLVLASGQIDTQTSAGSRLRDEIMGLRDDYLDAMLAEQEAARARGEDTVSVERAREIHAQYADTLATSAREAGVADEKIDDLVRTMLETPEVVAFALTDNGTVDAEKLRLIDLARQIRDTPDKEFEVDSKNISGVMESLRLLGVRIEDLPEGQVKVKADDGSFYSVEDWLNRLTTARTVKVYAQAGSGAGGMLAKADGGAIRGPGTGTSDSILARLSNGEHVLTAREVEILGGQDAVYRMRAAIRSGQVPHFAQGGGITGAASTLAIAQERQRAAQQAYAAAKSADARARAAEKAAKKGDSKDAKEAATDARQKASKRLSDAKSALSSADSALRSASSAYTSAKESLKAVQTDWSTSMRRGEPQQAGGLTLVDKLFDIADSIGGETGRKLRGSARTSESAFLKLAKAQEAAAEKTDLAKTAFEKAADVLSGLKDKAAQMASSVASAVRGLFNLGDMGKPTETTTTRMETMSQTVGGITLSSQREVTEMTSTPVTAGSIKTQMAATAARIKAFSDKLTKLSKRGLSPALLAEIASLGVENGEPIVDALLTATSAEIASINQSYNTIGSASAAAGQTVADANYKTLIEKAQAQVDKAEANVKATEKASADVQKKLEVETTRIIREITNALAAGRAVTVPKKASGGPIIGPGSALSDSIPIFASNGEHMWTAREVDAAGGHANVVRIRRAVLKGSLLAAGGPVVRGMDMGAVRVATRGLAAAYGDESTVGREGDVHLHMHALPQQGEPLGVQALRAANRLSVRRRTRR